MMMIIVWQEGWWRATLLRGGRYLGLLLLLQPSVFRDLLIDTGIVLGRC